MQKYDSVIFDLDGTLWDSVRSVVQLWNNALIDVGIEPTMNYDELSKCMGLTMEQILEKVLPFATPEQRDRVRERCINTENEYLSENGGILYDGVEETLAQLKGTHRLYIVSNCQNGYIQAFFKAHGLEKYFYGYECAGRTGKPKGENIRLVVQREGLERPVFVGDTIFDFRAATEAGVPFIFASYGFGDVPEAEMKAEKFRDIPELV